MILRLSLWISQGILVPGLNRFTAGCTGAEISQILGTVQTFMGICPFNTNALTRKAANFNGLNCRRRESLIFLPYFQASFTGAKASE